MRPQAFSGRKPRLAKLLARAGPGMATKEHIEADGVTVFAQACRMDFEGIVSKRVDSPYRSGRSANGSRRRTLRAPRRSDCEKGDGDWKTRLASGRHGALSRLRGLFLTSPGSSATGDDLVQAVAGAE